MRIYGGVKLSFKLTKGRVPVNNLASEYNAANIFACQTNVPVTGPRNKQEYQAMKQNLIVASSRNSEQNISSLLCTFNTHFSSVAGSSLGASATRVASGGNSSGGGGPSPRDGNGRKPTDDTKNSTSQEPSRLSHLIFFSWSSENVFLTLSPRCGPPVGHAIAYNE